MWYGARARSASLPKRMRVPWEVASVCKETEAQAARHGLLRFPVLQALCRWKASFSFFAELSGEDRDTVFCLLQPFSKKLKIIRREMDRRVRALPAASQLTMKIRRDGPQSSWPGGWAVHVCTLCGP